MPASVIQRPSSQVRKDPREYSSGIGKLPLGKVDANVLRAMINSGKGMAIRDSTWSKSAANIEQGKTIDLDIRSNAVTDKSGNGNHPTLSNVVLLNGEMQFNGTTSKATIPHNASFETSSFSISMRVKYNSFGTGIGRLFEKSNFAHAYYCFMGTDGLLRFEFRIDTAYTDCITVTPLLLNQIYDLVFTFERYTGANLGRASIYINGILNVSTEIAQAWTYGTEDLTIGNRPDLARPMNGSVYAVRTYDYALSPSEVKALSSATEVVLTDDGQASYWSSASATLTNDTNYQVSGVNCLKAVWTNPPQWSNLYKSSAQNWSGYDYISFYMKGSFLFHLAQAAKNLN